MLGGTVLDRCIDSGDFDVVQVEFTRYSGKS
jgi:hypothetical protein